RRRTPYRVCQRKMPDTQRHQLFGVLGHDRGTPWVAIRVSEAHGEVDQRCAVIGAAYGNDLLYRIEGLGYRRVGIAPLEGLGHRKSEPQYLHRGMLNGLFRATHIGNDGKKPGSTRFLS